MINEEINQLIKVKVEMQLDIINFVRQSFQKLDDLIQNKYKENPKHQHFKTRKEMRAAMLRDWNPYSTFSYGKKKPKEDEWICSGDWTTKELEWLRKKVPDRKIVLTKAEPPK